MGRAALAKANIITAAIVAILALGGGGAWVYVANSPAHTVQTAANAQHQLTSISYQGQNGVTALALLKKHATVRTKHYSFGDMVVSIDGSAGSGPKYWTFYVDGRAASTGAGSFVTKNGEKIAWKLQ
jgi:Domain of unknown function (DUF4430)